MARNFRNKFSWIQASNSRVLETEARGSQIQYQLGLHSKTTSKNKNKEYQTNRKLLVRWQLCISSWQTPSGYEDVRMGPIREPHCPISYFLCPQRQDLNNKARLQYEITLEADQDKRAWLLQKDKVSEPSQTSKSRTQTMTWVLIHIWFIDIEPSLKRQMSLGYYYIWNILKLNMWKE